MRPKIGDPAPDIRLFNQDKREVQLSERRGRNVVLLFFPLAFTSTCTAELCHIRDTLNVYNGLDADVYGISVDSLHALRRFREDQRLNFDLLSDFNRDASRAYDCLYPTFSNNMRDVSKRAAFVVDKTGMVRYAEVLENAGLQPNYDNIVNTLKAAH